MDPTSSASTQRAAELREEYVARINRVIDHIETHIDGELSLSALAKVACFSPFHFHRVFAAMMGETLCDFVARVRLERAASLLCAQPRRSITDIALACGFASSASFARAFRAAFHVSASMWRAGACHGVADAARSRRPMEALLGYAVLSERLEPITRRPQWVVRLDATAEPVLIETRAMPDLHVAYVRYVGRYQGMAEVFAGLFSKLARWAGPRGLLRDAGARWLAVYHDDPEITDDHKLRTSVCLTVPPDTPASGEVGRMVIAGGEYGVGRFVLGERDYTRAWSAMVGGWLPESGYQPDDRHCFELYDQSCEPGPDGRVPVEICVPVRPL